MGVDWSKLPDFAAVALLLSAFGSVARRCQGYVSGLWFAGWTMIAVHVAVTLFAAAPGGWGTLASFVSLASLTSSGILFMWASVPWHRKEPSSFWMFLALLSSNTIYVAVLSFAADRSQLLVPAAALMAALPLAVTVAALRRFRHPLRWITVGLYTFLAAFLLVFERRPGDGGDWAANAVLFTVYFDCSIHFWCAYRRATTGAFVTIAGFFTWASVFVLAPINEALLPRFHVETEVWNLPKYVVAIGMMLLLLEEQIDQNRHLALHDELTGLPNRRLFRDRLLTALERARRGGSQAALLVIDLDHFKRVNDTSGHHVGDLLLQHVGGMFSGRLRRSDTVARTGGDEFSVILEDAAGREDALEVARSLLELFENPFELDGHTLSVGATVGLAVFPEDAGDPESLSIAADLNMYAEKHASRACGDSRKPPRPGIMEEQSTNSG